MIIETVASKIVDILEYNRIITNKQKDIYQYGTEIFLSSMATCLITLILGLIFHALFAALIYFCIFVLLRSFCGGYHAKTYFHCNLIFIVVTTNILFLFKFMPIQYFALPYIGITVFSLLITIIYAPVENINKPITIQKQAVYRKICIILMCILFLLSYFLIFKFNNSYGILIDATIFAVAISMFVTDVKKGVNICGRKIKEIFS